MSASCLSDCADGGWGGSSPRWVHASRPSALVRGKGHLRVSSVAAGRRGNHLNTGVWARAGGARTGAARWLTGGATGRLARRPGRAALQRVQRGDLRARQVSLLRREVLGDSLASPAPSASVAGAVCRLSFPDGLHALPPQARGKRLPHFLRGLRLRLRRSGTTDRRTFFFVFQTKKKPANLGSKEQKHGAVVHSAARARACGSGIPAPRCVFACALCEPDPCAPAPGARRPHGERSNLERGPVILCSPPI